MVLATVVGMIFSLLVFLLDRCGWIAEQSSVSVDPDV
jgi:hypothetical protein